MSRNSAIKKKGGIEYLSALMLISLSGIILLYGIAAKELKVCQGTIRDGLDGACLAAALIDRDEYAAGNGIVIDNYYRIREIFCETLKKNIGLNDEYHPLQDAIYDDVTVSAFNVYSIAGGMLYTYEGSGEGEYQLKKSRYNGDEQTPDGILIQSGTIYAEIGMRITSYFGISSDVHLGTSVDVIEDK